MFKENFLDSQDQISNIIVKEDKTASKTDLTDVILDNKNSLEKESRPELSAAISAIDDLIKKYPYPETRQIITELSSDNRNGEKINQLNEQIEINEEKNKSMREILTELGILKNIDNLPIIDDELLSSVLNKNKGTNKNKQKIGDKMKRLYDSASFYQNFDKCFINYPVLTLTDYNNGKREPQSLFYQPTSYNEATNIEKIKQSKFYFLRSEIIRASHIKDESDIIDPLIEMPKQEMETAAAIYHPNYGNGYRNKNDELIVNYKKTQKPRRITSDWIKKDFKLIVSRIIINEDSKKKIVSLPGSPVVFLANGGYPNLVKNNLLVPKDFTIQAETADKTGIRAENKRITSNGALMFNNVRHFIGRKYAGLSVVKLNETLAGVIEDDDLGNKKLSHTFKIFKSEEVANRQKYGDKNYGWVGGKDTIELTKYDPTNYHPPRRADETEEQWKKRVTDAENFALILDLGNKLPSSINKEFSNLPFDQQRLIATGFNNRQIDEKVKIEFIDKFGLDGLKTFIGSDYGKNIPEAIFKLSNSKLGYREIAKNIFSNYSETINQSNSFALLGNQIANNTNDIPGELKKRLPIELQEAIMRKGTDLIKAAGINSDDIEKTKNVEYSLNGLNKFLDIIADLDLNNKYTIEPKQFETNTVTLSVTDKSSNHIYELKILTRAREHHHEGQARINLALSFDTKNPDKILQDAFQQSTTFHKNKKTKNESVLRIGLDLDTNESKGRREVSLDLGRNKYDCEDFTRTGDPLGNSLSTVSETGHHNPKSIDQRFADPEIFAKLVESFQKYLDGKFNN
ncbi:MAG: hypothetical protein WC621_05600 [Patescibacteria group bacterium]